MGRAAHEFEGRPMAQMTHVTFLETGGSWTVGQLPTRGAY
jgi:hypothetical protein